MKRTGFLHDIRYLLHDTGPYHPEMAERLQAIQKGVEAAGLLPHLTEIKAKPAQMAWIEAVHATVYIRRFEEVCRAGLRQFDYSDNQMCTETFDTALLAVGGVLEAVRMVMAGDIDNAFCAVRPPGHHAEVAEAMGFCYFNNIAIAARYLQKEWGIKRIGIVDFDVHHGNGTQHIFEEDPSVFYYSIHEHPSFAFPGTGRDFDIGKGAGEGFTKNSPMLPGQGDEEFKALIQKDLLPAFEGFQPEVILASVGFDALEADEMADMRLSRECFTWIAEQIKDLADQYARGRLISVLEGGYSLEHLGELAEDHLKVLLRD
jgi:acetoin utilization deacetylase AcuC-like enzyme